MSERVFARMWGIAVVAHIAGNWRYGDLWPDPTVIGAATAAAGILATIVVVRPDRRWLLALSAVIPVIVVLQAPILSNHWLLAGFVALAYLASAGKWDRFAPAARWVLVVFYAFAAFAKLNTGFLDPDVSCAVFYLNQALDAFGLEMASPHSPLGWASVAGTAVIELSVPVLLAFRRTRYAGALLGIGFHGLISLDLGQHFYDFTAVLLALFALFLPAQFAERVESRIARLTPLAMRLAATIVGVIGVSVTLAAVTEATVGKARFLEDVTFVWWIPYVVGVFWLAATSVARDPVPAADAGHFRGLTVPAAVLVVLVFANGLTPYLEVKTAFGWNMYANLAVVDGESNHLVVRSGIPLRDGHDGLVAIVETSDPGLASYVDSGWLLPWPSFRSYAADHPEAAVTYERFGTVRVVDRVGDDPELAVSVPRWWRWAPYRAVDSNSPPRCQNAFLPAL